MKRSIPTALATLVLLAGCGASFRPYTARAVMWRDDDRRPFAPRPAELYTPWGWSMVDNTLFRQASEALTYERAHESIDINALDEVPDSTWFTNRLSREDLSLDAIRRGACAEDDAPPTPYVVIHGKFTGSSPGAVVRAADGRQYVLKVDFDAPERDTAADAVSTHLLYAAGYDTPCDRVVYVHPADLAIDPHAKRSAHANEPYTEVDLAALLHEADAGPDDTRRVSLSLYLDGTPLGGFRFSGVRDDDPNDVVPHERRRELRGLYVLSAWMNHVDARAENDMDTWVDVGGGRGYVRHVILDAGDSFGIRWNLDVDDGMARRFGDASYFDVGQISGDLVSFGLADRNYRHAVRGPAFAFLGYYDATRFEPDQWHSGYPNPAFERRTEADCAWMARILSRFDEAKVRAAVDTGKISRALWREELVRILMARRARLLERYLVRLSPLSFPEVDAGHRVCMRDLAVESALREPTARTYRARRYEGLPPRLVSPPPVAVVDDGRVCVELPVTAGEPRYDVVDVFAATNGREASHPARLHFWQSPTGDYRLVGLERPDGDGAP